MPQQLSASRVLLPDGSFGAASIEHENSYISRITPLPIAAAEDCWLLLPGMVDLHGDAFERQLMPRGGVRFPYELALAETDSQIVANGITTAFYGLTVSWEPGLRSLDAAREFASTFAACRALLRADSRLHLRFESFAVDAAREVCAWIEAGSVHLLAFNDHTDFIAGRIVTKPAAMHRYSERSGLSPHLYQQALAAAQARVGEVSEVVAHLAQAARAAGIPMASHDDESPAMREQYAQLGCGICEFPVDRVTAASAIHNGSVTVLGAPNVLRGRSHVGRLSALEAIREGLCTVLSTDYYYPSLLQAAFLAPFPHSWDLVSKNPARAAGLHDRGEIAVGQRADLIFVDVSDRDLPRVAATISGGKLVYAAGPGPWFS